MSESESFGPTRTAEADDAAVTAPVGFGPNAGASDVAVAADPGAVTGRATAGIMAEAVGVVVVGLGASGRTYGQISWS